MESIITFITDSAKRADLLRHTAASLEGDINQKLVKLCQTRYNYLTQYTVLEIQQFEYQYDTVLAKNRNISDSH